MYPRLVEYIRQAKKRGYRDSEIRDVLVRQGWHIQDVDTSMQAASSSYNGSGVPTPKSPLAKVWLLFISPHAFFDVYQEEKSILEPWLYFILFGMASFIIGQVAAGIFSPLGLLGLLGALVSIIIGTLVFGALLLGFPFVASAITHLGVLMMGGKKRYGNTFKPLTYSGITLFIYAIIISILYNAMSFSLLKNINWLDPGAILNPNVITLVVVIGALIITAIIHVIVSDVIGISMCHKISKLRAFFGLLIPWLILLILAIILLAAISLLMGATILSAFSALAPMAAA